MKGNTKEMALRIYNASEGKLAIHTKAVVRQ